ncbi:MAG TPA: hypothetical protein VIP51_16040 [Eoetvoesiella sp.]
MAKTALSIMVDEKHLRRFAEIVKCCEDAGLEVHQELTSIGVITGSIDSSKIKSLSGIEGVDSIEESRPVQGL